jgi:hypothetical protein
MNALIDLAYKTKLGSSPAKSVLVSFCDQSNADGVSYANIDTVLDRTELKLRTLERILQIFYDLGLMVRMKSPDRRYKYVWKICGDRLGTDLRNEFREKFENARGVRGTAPGTPESEPEIIPGTEKDQKTVPDDVRGTEPLQPHKGGTLIEPLEPPRRLWEDPEGNKFRKVPDTTHHQVIALITQLYELGNPGIKCEWTGLAIKRWKAEQTKRPRWTLEQWLTAVRNRFASDNINVGDPPEMIFPSLPRYVSGPMTQYNRSKRDSDDHRPKTAAERNRAAAESAFADLDRAAQDGYGDD